MSDQDEVRIPERLLGAPEMIQACQKHDFAAIFSLVKRAGIYPAQIAKLCDMTPSRVGEIMQGKRTLNQMAVIERIADGLRIPGRMLRLADRPWESAAQPDSLRKNDSSLGAIGFELLRPPVLDEEALALKRELEAATNADASVAKLFASQVDMIRQLDRRLGAGPLLPQLSSQIEQMEGLLSHAIAPGGREPIAAALTEAATLAGWQALDLGLYRDAWKQHEIARSAARQSASPALLAHATAQQAYVLLDLGMPEVAVQQIQHARAIAGRRLPALLDAWLHAAEAEAHAAVGDEPACRRALDAAERARPSDPSDPTLPFLFLAGPHLDRWRGNCLATLGADGALRDLTHALGAMDGFNRAEAGVRCDLAVVLRRRGEIDEAKRQALRAHELATATHSLRQHRRIERVLQAV